MAQRPTIPKLPLIEDKELGVREYWYETFRRVIIVPLREDNCYLLSIDIYKELDNVPSGMVKDSLAIDKSDVEIMYVDLGKEIRDRLELQGIKPRNIELVIVVSRDSKRFEASDVRLQYCGLSGVPSYDEVERIYEEIVKLIEKRDPSREPLDSIVTRYRLKG